MTACLLRYIFNFDWFIWLEALNNIRVRSMSCVLRYYSNIYLPINISYQSHCVWSLDWLNAYSLFVWIVSIKNYDSWAGSQDTPIIALSFCFKKQRIILVLIYTNWNSKPIKFGIGVVGQWMIVPCSYTIRPPHEIFYSWLSTVVKS